MSAAAICVVVGHRHCVYESCSQTDSIRSHDFFPAPQWSHKGHIIVVMARVPLLLKCCDALLGTCSTSGTWSYLRCSCKTLPLSRVVTAFVTMPLPLLCVSTKTLPLPRGSTAFVTKTLPAFPGRFHRLR